MATAEIQSRGAATWVAAPRPSSPAGASTLATATSASRHTTQGWVVGGCCESATAPDEPIDRIRGRPRHGSLAPPSYRNQQRCLSVAASARRLEPDDLSWVDQVAGVVGGVEQAWVVRP